MSELSNILPSKNSDISGSLEDLPKDRIIELLTEQIEKTNSKDKELLLESEIEKQKKKEIAFESEVENKNKISSDNSLLSDNIDIEDHAKILSIFNNDMNLRYTLVEDIIKNDDILNLIIVRYKPISEDLLEQLNENIKNIKIIAVGYNQNIPNNMNNIEVINIRNGGDIKRTGILATNTIDDLDGKTILVYDSLDELLNYTSLKNSFKFIHTFTAQISRLNSRFMLCVDKNEMDEKDIGTFSSVFECVLEINDESIVLGT